MKVIKSGLVSSVEALRPEDKDLEPNNEALVYQKDTFDPVTMFSRYKKNSEL